MKHFVCLARIVFSIFLIFSPDLILAQNYLSSPESICYSLITKKYYVSSYNNGRIVEIDSNGVQTILITGQTHCAGNIIKDNTLYFSCINYVKGYDISVTPPQQIMNIHITESTFLDGITIDNSGNLYVCDNRYPNASRIYKINLAAQTYWTFVPEGHGLSLALQDLQFDQANNRLIAACAVNSNTIQMVKLSDSSVTNISSQVRLIDGLTRDGDGNYYFTSWQTMALHRFDSSFSGNAVIIAESLSGPSQPCYNPHKNLIAVPLYNGNQIAYIQAVPQGINNMSVSLKGFFLSQNYPNPFNPSTIIKFSLIKSGYADMKIFDEAGRVLANPVNSFLNSGTYEINFNAEIFSSGIFFCKLNFDNYSETKKMILIK